MCVCVCVCVCVLTIFPDILAYCTKDWSGERKKSRHHYYTLHETPLQWNPSIAATLGEWHFGCYTEVAVTVEFYTGVKLNRDQGYWPL